MNENGVTYKMDWLTNDHMWITVLYYGEVVGDIQTNKEGFKRFEQWFYGHIDSLEKAMPELSDTEKDLLVFGLSPDWDIIGVDRFFGSEYNRVYSKANK